ncbi:MAG: hypothetical protein HQK89_16495 [Nitrospirae bacterium]|nr:hypothetical protein [Nitrospirota bacterium]
MRWDEIVSEIRNWTEKLPEDANDLYLFENIEVIADGLKYLLQGLVRTFPASRLQELQTKDEDTFVLWVFSLLQALESFKEPPDEWLSSIKPLLNAEELKAGDLGQRTETIRGELAEFTAKILSIKREIEPLIVTEKEMLLKKSELERLQKRKFELESIAKDVEDGKLKELSEHVSKLEIQFGESEKRKQEILARQAAINEGLTKMEGCLRAIKEADSQLLKERLGQLSEFITREKNRLSGVFDNLNEGLDEDIKDLNDLTTKIDDSLQESKKVLQDLEKANKARERHLRLAFWANRHIGG